MPLRRSHQTNGSSRHADGILGRRAARRRSAAGRSSRSKPDAEHAATALVQSRAHSTARGATRGAVRWPPSSTGRVGARRCPQLGTARSLAVLTEPQLLDGPQPLGLMPLLTSLTAQHTLYHAQLAVASAANAPTHARLAVGEACDAEEPLAAQQQPPHVPQRRSVAERTGEHICLASKFFGLVPGTSSQIPGTSIKWQRPGAVCRYSESLLFSKTLLSHSTAITTSGG